MSKVTQLVVGLGQSSLLTPAPRSRLTPLQAAASAESFPPGKLCSGREERPFLSCLKNRTEAMGTGCLGQNPMARLGLMCPGLLCLLCHSWGSWLASWPWWGAEGPRAPLQLRTGQLERTKLCRTNSISLNLASERKTVPDGAQAADLPDNSPSTTHPDASFSGDLKGSWHPEGGFVWAAPPPGLRPTHSPDTFPAFALPVP